MRTRLTRVTRVVAIEFLLAVLFALLTATAALAATTWTDPTPVPDSTVGEPAPTISDLTGPTRSTT